MNITPDHWLEGATRLPYPAGPAMGIRRFAVQHFTSGATAKSSYEFWKSGAARGAEAHVIIDRDGTVYQIRPFNQQCDHAGLAEWVCPRLKKTFTYINSCSIGIEHANAGDAANADGTAFETHTFKMPAGFVRAKHKQGGPSTLWEQYPAVQIAASIAVNKAIKARYDLDDLIGHEDCAWRMSHGVKIFDRKNDPGPAFPMEQVRVACGYPAKIKAES